MRVVSAEAVDQALTFPDLVEALEEGNPRQGHRRRVEREHVLLEPQEDAAGGVTADAAVRHLHPGERRAEPSPGGGWGRENCAL